MTPLDAKVTIQVQEYRQYDTDKALVTRIKKITQKEFHTNK